LGYPDGEKYKKFWPADVHFVGKDILWFHSVIWPAMLMSAGLPLPKKVFAHGFWTIDGNKMSKTLGNVINPIQMKNEYGLDAFRYYLFSKSEFGKDNDFSEKALVDVLNTELADDLGNLVNRIVILSNKYFDGIVDIPDAISEEEKQFNQSFNVKEDICKWYESFAFSRVFKILWTLLRSMNKYITDKEPWTLYKEKHLEELKGVLFNLLEGLRIVAIFMQPLMPDTAKKILDVLGVERREFEAGVWRFDATKRKHFKLNSRKIILFVKKEFKAKDSLLHGSKDKTRQERANGKLSGVKPQITFEDFAKVDLRSAKIIEVEKFPDSKKLLKIKIDCGNQTRTIVAGIAKYYNVEDLIGQNIIVVLNLKPRKIHSTLSEAMLLAVEGLQGEPILIKPDKDIPGGLPVR
ncbi:MAG: methionine--tRNA ligase subunit beta, partial [Promethearchaeota archaeon]